MKIRTSCIECIREKAHRDEQDLRLEIRDDGIYSVTCFNGHESTIVLNHHKYEILFEMGVLALSDGYTREAVSNFAASLERFYEFSIEVFLRNSGVYGSAFEQTWKNLRNQSERQLGAYLILYLNHYSKYELIGKQPEMFDDKLTKFRNDVIHKGKFPSYDEVIKYSEAVFTFIRNHLVDLKGEFSDAVEIVNDKYIANYMMKNNSDGKHLVSWSENTVFRASRPIEEIKELNFLNCIDEKRVYRTFHNK
ncbi:hypothetical protein LOZ80_38695 [Paenibacillus sp. HWE-109]|uniref:hypothetical protein n=1 Tax=Paenibacillus sp. HWE-109 TaxID=1306526 RepID=UPI001EE1541E|nr:hypothetical protein [Paenibacillus sp. HWE-109]UKS27298.1 hypothetical protein LOZ80_38695 [Paenibacillus sp. HWE-109]